MTITCPQCQHKNPDDADFCENCGAQLPAPQLAGVSVAPGIQTSSPTAGGMKSQASDAQICPLCKAPYASGDAFCFNCGTDLSHLTGDQPVQVSQGQTPVSQTGGNQGSAFNAAQDLSNSSPPVSFTQSSPLSTPDQGKGRSADDWDKAVAIQAVAPPNTAAVASFTAEPLTPVPSAPISSGTADLVSSPNAFNAPLPAPLSTAEGTPSSTGALTLHISGPYGDEMLEYKGDELLLGRQDVKTRVFPEVNLDDSAASRRHLTIWKENADGLFYAQDLESSNGTNLNGRDMEPGTPTLIHNGDIIKIGTRYSIQIKIS